MAFADDLLEQAYHLANLEGGDPKQGVFAGPYRLPTTLSFIF
jgi:hypothetical protein